MSSDLSKALWVYSRVRQGKGLKQRFQAERGIGIG